MAGFSDIFETSLLQLILNATAIANIADNAASSPSTNIYVALHTADPGDTGTQGTNEASYTGYARAAVARTTSGWVVASGSASPVSAVTFGQATSTSTSTITHISFGLSSASTAGIIIAAGTISPNINISQNVTPSITTGSSFTLD